MNIRGIISTASTTLLLSLLLNANTSAHDFGGSSAGGPPPPPPQEPPPPCLDACQCRGGGGGGAGGGGAGGGGAGGSGDGSMGDPIYAFDGGFYLKDTDLAIGSNYPIRLVHRFDSRSRFDTALGYGWAFDLDRRLFEYPDGSVLLRTGCGMRHTFVFTGGAYVTPRDAPQGTLSEHQDGSYTYAYALGRTDRFDADGRLVSVQNQRGQSHQLIYDERGRLPLVGTSPNSIDPDNPMVVAYQPRLTRIQERGADGALSGAALDFYYNEETGRLTHIIASDGRRIDYTHDDWNGATRGNLIQVSGLDNYQHNLKYEDAADAHRLTGLQKGQGGVWVTNTYDNEGRVAKQEEGRNTIALSYVETGTTQITETVRDAAGAVLDSRSSTFVFDEVGYLTERTDPLGNQLRYIYNDSKDRLRSEVWQKQADGSLALLTATDYTYNDLAQRTSESVTLESGETISTSWTYDGSWIASEETVSSSDPQKIFRTEYEFVRDAQNNPVNVATIKRKKEDGTFATTRFTYCNGEADCPDSALLRTADGPRTDVGDITTYRYYATTDQSGCASGGTCHRIGDLKQIENALGHTIDYLNYDSSGRLTKVQDENGTILEYSYHSRGWLLEQTVLGPDNQNSEDDAVTRYQYDNRGNLTRITAADDSFLIFTYDERNRLIQIEDVEGGKVQYTLDSQGNRRKEEIVDVSGTLKSSLSRTFDQLNRLEETLGAQQQSTLYRYDVAGRLIQTTDALSSNTQRGYDALGRLVKTIRDSDDIAAETRLSYDAVGNLTQVTDPNSLNTIYSYNTWNQLTQRDSPDTGITTYTYDPAGNRRSQTDARGVTSQFTYDALNRPTGVQYPDSSLDVSYQYDQPDSETGCQNSSPTGRLTTMTDASGTTRYCYDNRGNLTQKNQITGGITLTTRYQYNLADQLTGITYPSGKQISYARDTQGRIAALSLDVEGQEPEVLIADIGYTPFGAATRLDYGNGHTQDRTLDQDYRPTAIQSSLATGLQLHFTLDDMGNITQIGNSPGTAERSLDYDSLYRLTEVHDAQALSLYGYSYDKSGNRQSKTTSNTTTEAYSYAADSHRLSAIDGTSRSYDANGNTLDTGGGQNFIYDDRNRLVEARNDDITMLNNQYNGIDERVAKITASDTRLFTYNPAGQLLGEYTANGELIKEYVWADNLPLAILESTTHYAIEADHLGTPRAVIDTAQQVAVWSWDLQGEPFGTASPDENPDGDGVNFTINLRFPGQYYDQETGRYYNYYRDYDPTIGRYLQSDPIGLQGGINTYSYVLQHPINYTDPLGLHTAVIINGATEGNPFGHTAVATSGSGVYSFGNATQLGSSVTGYLEREAPKRNTNVIVINTSKKQEEAINKYLGTRRDDLPPWILGLFPDPTDTCSTRTSEALNSAGLIDPYTFGPSFPTDVVAQAEFWRQQLGGVIYVVPKGGAVPPELKTFDPN
ncbi:RHS repeat-associated core domain-containing protein [Microbulbifer discodermiae]|uniref:RHS repeat-associated core domain-containing protein n=1 Tax=Microbulbifer sp. 2201CG32-9 TaxID=3232309 RepID=UPI00345BC505